MMTYSPGDVVLVNFLFSDETGVKRRPALVVSSNNYNTSRDEAILSAITSNTNRVLFGDHLVGDWRAAGLLAPSVATAIVRTVKQPMIYRKLGMMPEKDMVEVAANLRRSIARG